MKTGFCCITFLLIFLVIPLLGLSQNEINISDSTTVFGIILEDSKVSATISTSCAIEYDTNLNEGSKVIISGVEQCYNNNGYELIG